MSAPFPLALGSAASLMLGACGQSAIDPAANQVDDLPANVVANAVEPAPPPPEPRRERDRAPDWAGQEPSMKPEPRTAPRSEPPTPPKPATQPRRDILPSPVQPPAEIDPVLPDPGDKVPE
jgi:hypothetical protein